MATPSHTTQAKDHLQKAASEARSAANDAYEDLKDRARSGASSAEDQLGKVASDVSAVAQDATREVREVAKTFTSAVEESLRERPLTTLGVAVMAAFMLGAVWKT